MIDSGMLKIQCCKFAATIVLVIVVRSCLRRLYLCINSFKPYAEMMTSFVSFPNSLDLNNYVKHGRLQITKSLCR